MKFPTEIKHYRGIKSVIVVIEDGVTMIFTVTDGHNGTSGNVDDGPELKMTDMVVTNQFLEDTDSTLFQVRTIHLALKVELDDGPVSYLPIMSEAYDALFADTTKLKNIISIAGTLEEKNCLAEILNIGKILPITE